MQIRTKLEVFLLSLTFTISSSCSDKRFGVRSDRSDPPDSSASATEADQQPGTDNLNPPGYQTGAVPIPINGTNLLSFENARPYCDVQNTMQGVSAGTVHIHCSARALQVDHTSTGSIERLVVPSGNDKTLSEITWALSSNTHSLNCSTSSIGAQFDCVGTAGSEPIQVVLKIIGAATFSGKQRNESLTVALINSIVPNSTTDDNDSTSFSLVFSGITPENLISINFTEPNLKQSYATDIADGGSNTQANATVGELQKGIYDLVLESASMNVQYKQILTVTSPCKVVSGRCLSKELAVKVHSHLNSSQEDPRCPDSFGKIHYNKTAQTWVGSIPLWVNSPFTAQYYATHGPLIYGISDFKPDQVKMSGCAMDQANVTPLGGNQLGSFFFGDIYNTCWMMPRADPMPSLPFSTDPNCDDLDITVTDQEYNANNP